MPKVTRSLRRVVRQVFPQLEEKEALRLLEMGLLRIPRRLRCGAHARSTGKPCKAQAIPGPYRCKNHGAPKSEAGRKAISDAQKRRWSKGRAEKQSGDLRHDEP